MTTLIPKYDLKNGGSTPSGAINRPFNEKLNEVISVKDFGATGDGTTDDAAAIQATVNYAIANSKTIYFPDGTYIVNTSITLTSATGFGLRIYGESKDHTIIKFYPTTNSYLFDATAYVDGGLSFSQMSFYGTNYYFDPNKTPSILSGLLTTSNSGSATPRLRMDSIFAGGFNASYTVLSYLAIESYITKSFFFGPYYNLGDSSGTTTTRTASCFYVGPNCTTHHFTDTFIQCYKIGIEFANAFSNRVTRCTLETNFIAVVSRTIVGAAGNSISNLVKDCYFETNLYSLGGAAVAGDYTDTSNTAKWGNIVFVDGYMDGTKVYGGTSILNQPCLTYGNINVSFGANIGRTVQLSFIPSQRGISHSDNQFDSFLSTNTNPTTATYANLGIQMGYPKNINNNSYDKTFRIEPIAPPSGVGSHASWSVVGNTEYNNADPINDSWNDTYSVTRFRVNGGNAYLSGGGAYNTSGADYAEMFEWDDGNPNSENRIGKLVYLSGDKVTLTASGEPIGVVSATASVIGNNWSEQWSGRWLVDDLGQPVLKDGSPVENSNYDPSKKYISRSERKEWATVGLVGRIRVLSNQTIPSDWIKLKDISSTVTEYLVK